MNNKRDKYLFVNIPMYPHKHTIQYVCPFGVYVFNLDCKTKINTLRGFSICKPYHIHYVDAFTPFHISGESAVGQSIIVQIPPTVQCPRNLNNNGIAVVSDPSGLCQTFYQSFQNTTDSLLYYDKLVESFAHMIHYIFMSQNGALISTEIRCPKIRKASSYIHQHLDQKITIKDLSNHVNLSPSYFTHHFKEILQETPTEYIQHARMKKAKHLLTHHHLSVEEVARSLGYKDTSWFIKVFIKCEGIHPRKVLKSFDSNNCFYLDT